MLVADAIALFERVIEVVPPLSEVIVVPAGMPAPVTCMPTVSPVLVTVTTLPPATVTELAVLPVALSAGLTMPPLLVKASAPVVALLPM